MGHLDSRVLLLQYEPRRYQPPRFLQRQRCRRRHLLTLRRSICNPRAGTTTSVTHETSLATAAAATARAQAPDTVVAAAAVAAPRRAAVVVVAVAAGSGGAAAASSKYSSPGPQADLGCCWNVDRRPQIAAAADGRRQKEAARQISWLRWRARPITVKARAQLLAPALLLASRLGYRGKSTSGPSTEGSTWSRRKY